MPSHLYRYRAFTPDRLNEIIVDHSLYFTSPSAFNDPFDCKPFMNLEGSSSELEQFFTDQVNEKYQGQPAAVRQFVQCMFGPHVNLTKKVEELSNLWHQSFTMGICCFSEPKDNILMWSHYADCHRGVCLEFTFEPTEPVFRDAKPIEYASTYPEMNYLKQEGQKGMFLRKASDWSYEKEWRVFSNKTGLVSFRPDALTGIIFGCRIQPSNITLVRSWIGDRKITLYQAKQKTREFGLSFEKIEPAPYPHPNI
jgi:hypothetical protein